MRNQITGFTKLSPIRKIRKRKKERKERKKEKHQNVTVLADCNDGTATWKEIGSNNVSSPGKRGPRGQKGEAGIGVNVTALREELQGQNDRGPELHFYANTVTWAAAQSFCRSMGKDLCSYDQICLPHNGGRALVNNVVPGDNWIPLIDQDNEWTQIGNRPHSYPCILHSASGKPSWGTSFTAHVHKGYVYCCSPNPDMKYQYIGKSATYDSSKEHCEKQGRRLCYSSEICQGNSPRFGVAASDQWAAVQDRRNEWIQVGNNGHSCGLHGSQLGLPDWGVRSDGSNRNFVGYVHCCAITAEK